MAVSAARAEFVKTGYRTVKNGPITLVISKYGDSARKTIEPVSTFFETQSDAQAMCDERATLQSKDRRAFSMGIIGEGYGLAFAYNQATPQATVIDDKRQANHPSAIVEFSIDFSSQKTTVNTWGGN